MTVRERAQFLVDRYGEKCIEVVNEIIINNATDEDGYDSYWKKVLKACKEILKEKNIV
jgi:hypothetical protein